jgi:hypothetical protein
MVFAETTSLGDLVLFWLIVIPLAIYGCRKFGRWFDDKGEIKEATQKGVLGLVGKFFKK